MSAAALLIATVTVVLSVSGQADAQAQQVHAQVRSTPQFAEPGDDVTVDVLVTGCPSGPVSVEVYLSTSDGAARQAALMARVAATTTLLLRTKAILTLPDAIEGWYGVRVLCGNFRPPKQPMANTLFPVGIPSTKSIALSATSVAAGGGVGLTGTQCTGTSVEYDLTEGNRYPGEFTPDGTAVVNPDGTWTALVLIPPTVDPGPASIRARCASLNAGEQTVYTYYDQWTPMTVTPAA